MSLVELLVMLGVIAVVAGILLPAMAREREKARRIKCHGNLKIIGLAFRIFATDNNDLFPARLMVSNGVELTSIDLLTVYRALSNELSTPRQLHCPSETKREGADASINFDTMTLKNISYFTSLSADESMPQIPLAGDRNLATNGVAVGPRLLALTTKTQVAWTREMHEEQGNVLMGDGSVQRMNDSDRFTGAVADQGIETNWVLVP